MDKDFLKDLNDTKSEITNYDSYGDETEFYSEDNIIIMKSVKISDKEMQFIFPFRNSQYTLSIL